MRVRWSASLAALERRHGFGGSAATGACPSGVTVLDLWFKQAVIYCLDVETYADGNGDGIGDFVGLCERLDYLAGLGVTCIWLLPFYVSPNLDNGYDVSDYYAVDPRHGCLGDFVEFTHQAEQRGIRVIVDLVVNHTSNKHPWFQAARRDPSSKYFDYYVWSKRRPEDAESGVVFPGVQRTTWTYDGVARAYYFHRFYEHQPDLNIGNPEVREEILKIMGFWLQLGVSGFRMDAVPFVIEKESWQQGGAEEGFEFIEQMRDFLAWRSRDAIILAEANLPFDEVTKYFGDGNHIHMIFNFLLNQHMFLSLATEQSGPIMKTLEAMPVPPVMCQWVNFLRNHDEIDLGRLSDEERQQVFQRMGPQPRMQLYDRGIRRRLAPMLGGDRRLLELAYSLMFSMPGTPVIWFGDEIGMGDDLSLPEREAVRTPMQWSDEAYGGFTSVRSKVSRRVISRGAYSYEHVNLAAQRRTSDSLLNYVERLIRARKECPEFGWGTAFPVDVRDPAVEAHCCEWRGSNLLAVHNLTSEGREVTLDLSSIGGNHVVDVLENYQPRELDNGKCRLLLDGHGHHWFRVVGAPTKQ
jgi:maltose alpha-D-glucosyltransferase/alpha-amylase